MSAASRREPVGGRPEHGLVDWLAIADLGGVSRRALLGTRSSWPAGALCITGIGITAAQPSQKKKKEDQNASPKAVAMHPSPKSKIHVRSPACKWYYSCCLAYPVAVAAAKSIAFKVRSVFWSLIICSSPSGFSTSSLFGC
uniref:Uncharacterized protein n=1 Tax=Oryza brachyantha TaxID=4533 RepID=J3MM83_ORYBR